MTKQGLSLRGYSRRAGVRLSYVQKLVSQGVISLLPDGSVDPLAADTARNRHTDAGRWKRERFPAPENTRCVRSTRSAAKLLQARTVHETYKAKQAKLEYLRLTGKLVEIDKVMDVVQKAFTNVKVRMRSLPRRLAPLLAMNHSPAEIEKILSDAIHGALESLSEDVFKHD